MTEHTELLFLSAFIIILTACVASVKYTREPFADETGTQEVVAKPSQVISNRIQYVKAGLVNFYAQMDNVDKVTENTFIDFIRLTIQFWPNYQDLCCSGTVQKTSGSANKTVNCDCNNITILNSSCYDNALKFTNEGASKTISQIGTSDNNCMMTILQNDYRLVKRSLNLQIGSTEHVGPISKQMYKLVIGGNIAPFVLSRPMFISFNTLGLYRVIYDDYTNRNSMIDGFEDNKTRNVFAFFDSTKKNGYKMFLEKIKNSDYKNFELYSDTPATINGMTGSSPATIYYVNYQRETKGANLIINSATFFVDNVMYDELFQNNSNISIVTGASNSRYASAITFTQNANESMSIAVDGETFNIPSEFVYYGTQNNFLKWHIIVTYSFDVLTIVCFGVQKQLGNANISYMVRYHPRRTLNMSKDTLLDTLQKRILSDGRFLFMNKTKNNDYFSEVMNVTSIPNYAFLAQTLGYTFDV